MSNFCRGMWVEMLTTIKRHLDWDYAVKTGLQAPKGGKLDWKWVLRHWDGAYESSKWGEYRIDKIRDISSRPRVLVQKTVAEEDDVLDFDDDEEVFMPDHRTFLDLGIIPPSSS